MRLEKALWRLRQQTDYRLGMLPGVKQDQRKSSVTLDEALSAIEVLGHRGDLVCGIEPAQRNQGGRAVEWLR